MTIEPTAQIVAVSLDRIVRLSPLNPRQDTESDVSDLAAMIRTRGQQYPIKLRVCPEDPQSYEVLDGGRRWRALRALAEAGDERDAQATIVKGDEIEAREVALMVSVSPKPLHPVDEYESFARLEESGASAERIAADFGQDVRHVRQRLALGRLSPRVRALWRAGDIDREEAIAFTAGPIEAQDALLDELAGKDQWEWSPHRIRRQLRGETLSNSGPEGKFLLSDKSRVEAYVAAGGRIEDNLFEDEIVIRDPSIARKIVDEALRAEAERIKAEEGWGAALIEDDGAYEDDQPDELDLTIAESGRLEEIETETRDADPSRARALRDEQDAICRDALLRMIEHGERTQYAVGAFLDHDGRVFFARALPAPQPETVAEEGDSEGEGASLPLGGEGGEQSETGEVESRADEEVIPNPLAEPGKALRAVIDETATQALRDVTRRRGDIALMLAVAALGCQYGKEVVKLSGRQDDETADETLLGRLAHARFDEALAICAEAPTCDLSVALFRLVAASIETRDARFETIGAITAAVCARGGDLKGAFDAALDRRAFFETAPKQITLGCVTGLIGEAEASRVKKMKKGELGEYVARLSKDKGHLPAPFADWAAAKARPGADADAIIVVANPSLAQAMENAITADQESDAAESSADRRQGGARRPAAPKKSAPSKTKPRPAAKKTPAKKKPQATRKGKAGRK